MKRVRAIGAVVSASALIVSGLVLSAGPAAASHVRCGDVITQSVTFDSDVTNCKAGLHVMGDDITIDLNGYTLSGRNHPNDNQFGIHLMGTEGTTVTSSIPGGTVTGFDVGVYIDGNVGPSSGNTVSNLIVRDNVNDLLGTRTCDVGDGILVDNSDDNVIDSNTVRANGPYSGIALIFDADGNTVSDNIVAENNVVNAFQGSDKTGPCGEPFSRRIQDIGIRIEGPGSDDNVVIGNTVTASAIVGISIHGYICNPPAELGIDPQDPNTGNQILNNEVSGTGSATFPADTLADGIAVLAQGPAAIVCTSYGNTITGNTSFDNLRDGINLNRSTHDNTVDDNVVYDNGRHGLVLAAGTVSGGITYPGAIDNSLTGNTGYGNGTNPYFATNPTTGAPTPQYDGADLNPGCDNNAWHGNVFGTYNQPCVVAP